MIKKTIEKNRTLKPNHAQMAVLREHFSGCFDRDGNFDMRKFQAELADKVDFKKESYGLEFLGKNYARYLYNIETETVIVPDIKHNNKAENKHSENIYITADNLDALKHLEKSYSNSIMCIYVDPPYNTGSDGFSYSDKFNFTKEQLAEKLDVSIDEAERILGFSKRGSNSHSAWLTFMYPRLKIAQRLLSSDGVMFISIDDNQQANLKLLCDEIFGEGNVEQLIWRKTDMTDGVMKITHRFRVEHEYVLAVYKNKSNVFFNKVMSLSRVKGKYPNPDKDYRGDWISCELGRSDEK